MNIKYCVDSDYEKLRSMVIDDEYDLGIIYEGTNNGITKFIARGTLDSELSRTVDGFEIQSLEITKCIKVMPGFRLIRKVSGKNCHECNLYEVYRTLEELVNVIEQNVRYLMHVRDVSLKPGHENAIFCTLSDAVSHIGYAFHVAYVGEFVLLDDGVSVRPLTEDDLNLIKTEITRVYGENSAVKVEKYKPIRCEV